VETLIDILIVLAILVLLVYFVLRKKRKQVTGAPISETYRQLLGEQVEFYKKLDEQQKQEFENRIQSFLTQVRITGIKTTVEDIDRVLIASSAVIPIFNFPGWEYVNLNEVLLYPDAFSDEFEQEGQHRNTLGMVGSGAMNNVMLLSQHELRQAFLNKTGKTNLAIHEFVHLVDKMDGAVDGIPAFILERKYILPWLELMQKNIQNIIADESDINPYGATNKAEFFAVVAEYFFERPDLLKTKHPELYDLLAKIFRQQPSYIQTPNNLF
jgi:Mlc titration factor MtfA (ptsG expression regulator)